MMETPLDGIITFLFSDIEGSTRLWEQQPEAMRAAVGQHDAILAQAIAAHGGQWVKSLGDGVLAAFPHAGAALAAVLDAQRSLAATQWDDTGPLRVRMALHSGPAEARNGDYFGPTLNRAARMVSVAYGGQVLLSHATTQLLAAALTQDHTIRAHSLGLHQLAGLVEAEEIFQLIAPDLPEHFPPLRTLGSRPTNLTPPETPLIGRQRELALASALLQPGGSPEVRLLTLRGPGGIGKSALAAQIAWQLLDQFQDGLFLIPLATLQDPAQLGPAIAAPLGVKEIGRQPITESLKFFLGEKRLLLVLDHFEHLAAATPLLSDLLRHAPHLKFLVTSRVRLNLTIEHELELSALECPPLDHAPHDSQGTDWLDTIARAEAVQLFLARAAAVLPEFALSADNAVAVAELCRRLDGLPLAIEVAAAGVARFAPHDLLARLDGQRTLLDTLGGSARIAPQPLRTTIEWSYTLLDSSEQVLFARLATFAGGCTLGSARMVCQGVGPDGTRIEVLTGLASLVDKSLLRRVAGPTSTTSQSRFTMLATIRAYAQEQLAASGEESQVRDRHLACFLALAEQAEPKLTSAAREEWLRLLLAEHDNFRAALTWSLTSPNPTAIEAGLRLASALLWFWQFQGLLSEGRQWLERLLAQTDPAAPTHAMAQALRSVSTLMLFQGDYPAAQISLPQCIAMAEQLDAREIQAWALTMLGLATFWQGNRAGAIHLAEGVNLFRTLEAPWHLAFALHCLSFERIEAGDYTQAQALCEESLALYRALEDPWGVALALLDLGNLAYRQREYAEARLHLEESLALWRGLSDRWRLSQTLGLMGEMARSQGADQEAMAFCQESVALSQALGHLQGAAWAYRDLSYLALRGGDLPQAAAYGLRGLRLFCDSGYQLGMAACLAALAGVWATHGLSQAEAERLDSMQHAARLYGASQAMLTAIPASLAPADHADGERSLALVRATLDPERFNTAWDEGQALPPDQLIHEALNRVL